MCCPTEKSILEKEVRALKIQESAENYLEAILVLTQKNGQVRSIDVAHYTGFSKPSISRAVGLLRDNGYVPSTRTVCWD